MDQHRNRPQHRVPWNKDKLIGQKAPLKLKEIWAIRIRLQLARRTRDLALFNLDIDSKLRGCDLVGLRVCDVAQGGRVGVAGDRDAAENTATRSVRINRANTRSCPGVDHAGETRR